MLWGGARSLVIRWGPRVYDVRDTGEVFECLGTGKHSTAFSEWLHGILHGKKRNDAGELIEQEPA